MMKFKLRSDTSMVFIQGQNIIHKKERKILPPSSIMDYAQMKNTEQHNHQYSQKPKQVSNDLPSWSQTEYRNTRRRNQTQHCLRILYRPLLQPNIKALDKILSKLIEEICIIPKT